MGLSIKKKKYGRFIEVKIVFFRTSILKRININESNQNPFLQNSTLTGSSNSVSSVRRKLAPSGDTSLSAGRF